MIDFNELRITPDGNNLIIDVSVSDLDYFDNVTISQIIIDTNKNFSMNGPQSKPIYEYRDSYDETYSVPENGNCNPVLVEDDKAYCLTENTYNKRHVRLMLDRSDFEKVGIQDINFTKNLFFVYVIPKGAPNPKTTPCTWDRPWEMQTVCNLLPIYQRAMSYVNETAKRCVVSVSFIDRILEYKAFSLAIKTGNYVMAIKYWEKFFENKNFVEPKNCGCNGIY